MCAHNAAPARCGCDPNDPKTQPYARPTTLNRQGAYYYVWEAFNIPPRPWAAEVGLQLVKEDLYQKGVPVAYMQLDDWCVQRAPHAAPACSARLQHLQLRPLQSQNPNRTRAPHEPSTTPRWYTGKFFFGNVKSVTDWHASTVPRLFPSGLNAFADKLGLPLQLYTPFFADDFVTPYNMTESTAFKGTKIVTPKDSFAFFSDLFDRAARARGLAAVAPQRA
jgi:hypothetical protein